MSDRLANIIGDKDAQRFGELVKRLPNYMRLVKQIIIDPTVPAKSKAYLSVGGMYALSPIDLVPGIIPIAGQLDDAYAILYGLKKSLESMSPEQSEHHLSTAGITLQEIDDDISLVISIAKRLGRLVITAGAKIGRAGKATFRYARDTIGKWK